MPTPSETDPHGNRARPLDALLLGLIHGPTEMVPVSSSGHTTLVPWLAGLPYSRLASDRRKRIEVALHAGTALALTVAPLRSEVAMPRRRRALGLSAVSLVPTALAGLLAGGWIKRDLGTPRTVMTGLAAGSAVLIAAETRSGERTAADWTAADAAIVGTAQAAALWPGVSRSAMAISSLRMLGFRASDSARLARTGIVPTAIAASTLEAAGAFRDRGVSGDGPAIATAAAASFASTLIARPLLARLERGGSLLPWAAVRLLTAGLVAQRIRSLGDDARR